MTVEYSRRFKKTLSQAPREIVEQVLDVVLDFVENPFAAWLNNHALHGKWAGLRSINVTDDYRAVFRFNEKTDTSRFVVFGTHKELYG